MEQTFSLVLELNKTDEAKFKMEESHPVSLKMEKKTDNSEADELCESCGQMQKVLK